MNFFQPIRFFKFIFLFQFVSYISFVASAPGTHGNSVELFTANETAALDRLRNTLGENLYEDYMKEDIYLIRWIRDQNFNLEKAKEKLSKHLKWRKENQADSVLDEDFSDIIRDCPFDLTGIDLEGRPILTSNMGRCQLRKIVLRGKARLDRATIYLMEKMYKIGRDSQGVNGNYPQTGIIIADMSGLSLREHTCLACAPFYVTLFDLYINHYPELISEIYIVNVPRFALSFIDVLRPLAPPNFRETVYAFGFDRKEWEAELRKKIRPDQLTQEFGGTKSRREATTNIRTRRN